MNRCLICGKTIEDSFSSIFNVCDKLCYGCCNSFKKRNEGFNILGCKGKILFYYNGIFKDVLFMYKGCGDLVLKEVFEYLLIPFKNKYRGYVIVVAPSNEEREVKRGFSHLEEIFKCFNLPIIKCFKKESEWKQSDKSYKQRQEIQNIIKVDNSLLKGVKKVLIVDDVLTSGSTIKTMVSQMDTNIVKKVLVLASNCRIKANEII